MASMAESRQQRRARERAEAKTARRSPPAGVPGPVPAPPAAPAPKRQRVLEVELTRFDDDGAEADEDPVAWHAEWALRGDDVATEDSGTDVSELINGVVEDAAAQWGSRHDLTIEWKLSAGDPLPEGQTIEGILNGLGVVLPRTVPAPPQLRKTGVRRALPVQAPLCLPNTAPH
jgi:hypothetical protein